MSVCSDEEVFQEANDQEFPARDILDKIIKDLDDSSIISMFFLLMDHIESHNFLYMIERDRSQKEQHLINILKHKRKGLLIDLLQTIQRYDLLKFCNTCNDSLQHHHSSLSTLWKSLYEVCEFMDKENDMKLFKEAFKELEYSDDEQFEIVIVKAVHEKIISKTGLEVLLNKLNEVNQISKTWPLHNEYLIRSPTVESPCGLAVIVNHVNFNDGKTPRRDSSPLDVDALEKLWKSFGFEILTFLDYTSEEIISEFQKLAQKDFSSYDVFVACYMSHGNEGVVVASDCKPISISCLIDYMANKCKTLINKPKLFFIEACQGDQIQSHPIEYQSTAFLNSAPLFADVLVAISSIPGFASYASEGKNSWFIEALVDNMLIYGDKESILDVLTKVNNHVSERNGRCIKEGLVIRNCKQTVEQKHTLRKIVLLKKLK